MIGVVPVEEKVPHSADRYDGQSVFQDEQRFISKRQDDRHYFFEPPLLGDTLRAQCLSLCHPGHGSSSDRPFPVLAICYDRETAFPGKEINLHPWFFQPIVPEGLKFKRAEQLFGKCLELPPVQSNTGRLEIVSQSTLPDAS